MAMVSYLPLRIRHRKRQEVKGRQREYNLNKYHQDPAVRAQRKVHNRRRRGIDPVLAEELLAHAEICEICRRGDVRLVPDHDHETGKLRGALCEKCNMAVGLLKDRQENCLAAAIYLEKYSGG